MRRESTGQQDRAIVSQDGLWKTVQAEWPLVCIKWILGLWWMKCVYFVYRSCWQPFQAGLH